MMQNRKKYGRYNVDIRDFVFLDARKEHDRLKLRHYHHRGGDQEAKMQELDSP
jgi:hypothetical protein